MKKTCILFGAGADSFYDVKTGEDFALRVVGEHTEVMNKAIIKFYNDFDYENNDWCNKITKSDLVSNGKLNKKIVKTSLKVKHLTENLQCIKNKTSFDNEIANKLKNLDEFQTKNFFLNNRLSYMGILESKFHSFIYPKFLGPDNFWIVVKCYARAYLTIIEDILEEKPDENRYLEYLRNPKKILNEIHEKIDLIKERNSYYSVIAKAINNAKEMISIVTTNYTPICEQITHIENDKIAYIHGKIGLFEDPYLTKVSDVSAGDELPKSLYVPYLFVQSGVKPIIENTQITAYHKMIKFFDSAERIIIVGYRLNVDDHHVNCLIRNNFYKKEIIYLDFDDLKSEYITRVLRLDKNENCLKHIKINRENCLEKFKRILLD